MVAQAEKRKAVTELRQEETAKLQVCLQFSRLNWRLSAVVLHRARVAAVPHLRVIAHHVQKKMEEGADGRANSWLNWSAKGSRAPVPMPTKSSEGALCVAPTICC